MLAMQKERNGLPLDVYRLLDHIPTEYLRDLAIDMAWAALIAPRRPDALHQVVVEWEATLEEIRLAGDDLPNIQRARQEVESGLGMTPDELRIYLESDER